MGTRDSSSEEASQPSFSADSVSLGKELFLDLANSKIKVRGIVKHWLREIYAKNKERGEYSLIELVFRCAGYERSVTPAMAKFQYTKLVEVFTNDNYDRKYGAFPLLGRKSKLNAKKLAEFISELIIECKVTLVAYDDYLLPNLSEFLKNAAQTGYNNLRHTAAFVALKLTTALITVEKEDRKMLDRSSGDLQDALNSRQASRITHMKEKASQKKALYESRLQKIQQMTKYLTKVNFANTFKDMIEPIQRMGMEELGVWIQTMPSYIPKLGKFVIQAMYDSAMTIRLAALKIVETALDSVDDEDDDASQYDGFFEAVFKVLPQCTLDINEEVALLAFKLIGLIEERFPSAKAPDDEMLGVANMVYASRRRIAQAAGVLLLKRLQYKKKSAGVLFELARFHAKNCRDYPELFSTGTELLLLVALPTNCPELTDWDAMANAALDANDTEVHALGVIIVAAVAVALNETGTVEKNMDTNEQLRRMTEAFMSPLATLLNRCNTPGMAQVYLEIILKLDATILCQPIHKTASTSIANQLASSVLCFPGQLPLVKKCAAVLGQLVEHGLASAVKAIDTVYEFVLAKLEENFSDSSEDQLTMDHMNFEHPLCLLAGFGSAMPLPNSMKEQLLEFLTEVGDDAALKSSRWSPQAHGYAIEALHYNNAWGRETLDAAVVAEKAYYLLKVIRKFLESTDFTEDATRTAVSCALDILTTCNPDDVFRKFAKLSLRIAEFLENRVVTVEDLKAKENRPLIVAYFKLLIGRYIEPKLSALLYKNYSMMSSTVQTVIADAHLYFWQSSAFYDSLSCIVIAGLKSAYDALQQNAAGRDLELSQEISELAKTADVVCSWLFPVKNVSKRDYEKKAEEIFKCIAECITICIDSRETTAPFCAVLTPFASKLSDSNKKKMLKLVMKGFAGMASPAVKKFICRLKMKNASMEKVSGKPTTGDADETTLSPIAHQRLDNLQYMPLPLQSSKIRGGVSRRMLTSSRVEGYDPGTDHSNSFESESCSLIESQPSSAVGSDPRPPKKKSLPVEDLDLAMHCTPSRTVGVERNTRKDQPSSRKGFNSEFLESQLSPIQSSDPEPVEKHPSSVEGSDLGPHRTPIKPAGRTVQPLSPKGSDLKTVESQPAGGSDHRSLKPGYKRLLKQKSSDKPAVKVGPRDFSSPIEPIAEASSSKRTRVVTSETSSRQIKRQPRKPYFAPLAIQTVRQNVGRRGKNAHSPGQESLDSIQEYPACSLAANYSPAMAIAAEKNMNTSGLLHLDDSMTNDKPAEISSVGDSSDESLPYKAVRDCSVASDKAMPPKTPISVRCTEDFVESFEMSCSVKNTATEKCSITTLASSSATNVTSTLYSRWSVTAAAGSFDKNSVQSSTVAREEVLDSNSSQESGGVDSSQPSKPSSINKQNDQMPKAQQVLPTSQPSRGDCVNKGQEKSPTAYSGSNAFVVENLPARKYQEDEPQICSSQQHHARSSPLNSIVEEEAEDACHSEDYDSEDFIPSSQLHSISSEKRFSPEIASHLVELMSEDDSDYNDGQLGATESNSGYTNKLPNSLKEAQAASLPDVGGMGDVLAKEDGDCKADSVQILGNQENIGNGNGLASFSIGITAASSSEISGIRNLLTDDESDYEEDPGVMITRLATANSGRASRLHSSPADVVNVLSPDIAGRGTDSGSDADMVPKALGSISENDSNPDSSESERPVPGQKMPKPLAQKEPNPPGSLSESDCELDSSDSDVQDSGQKMLEQLARLSQESIRKLSGSLYRDCQESDDQASSGADDQVSLPIVWSTSSDTGNVRESRMKPMESVANSSPVSSPSSTGDIKSECSEKSVASVATSSVMSPPGSLMSIVKNDACVTFLTSIASSLVSNPPNSLMDDIESDGSEKSCASVATSSVMSSPGSLMSVVQNNISVKSPMFVASSLVSSPPNSLMGDVESDGSEKSFASVATSSVKSPPGSLMNVVKNTASAPMSVASSVVSSPPNSLMDDIESDGSEKSFASVATSSVMSPPGSLISVVKNTASAPMSVASSVVSSPPNSLMGDIESDGSEKSFASVATSSVMSAPGSLISVLKASVKSAMSVASSLVSSPPNSLMGEIGSDGSVQSPRSVAPSSVGSPPDSLMSDIDSE